MQQPDLCSPPRREAGKPAPEPRFNGMGLTAKLVLSVLLVFAVLMVATAFA